MKTKKFGLNRLQWILIGVLVAQVVLAVVLNLPQRTQASSGPLLEGFDPTTIVEMLIENQTGDQLHTQKVNGSWVLPEKGDFPVDAEKVTELLNKINNVKTDRMVTQTAASHNQLRVAEDEFNSKIILTNSDGSSYLLYLGSSSGAGATHIRLSGQNQVYLTAELASWEVPTALSSWIDTTFLSLEQDQIQSIRVQNANGTFTFVKGVEGDWAYDGLAEGEQFDADGFQSTVSRLASLRMLEPLGTEAQPSYRFDDPNAIVVLAIKDESESTSQLTLTIGALLDSGYAAQASSSPYYVKVAQSNVTPLVEMDHASLLVVEPTPTPMP